METRSIGNYRAPYVRGPHVKYFFMALIIALLIAVGLMAAGVFVIQLLSR
jgi:hypothetical protein